MFGMIDLVAIGVIVASFAIIFYNLRLELKIKA
jgi:hypothetical protein